MVAGFFDSTMKVFTKRPSSYKAIPNHPLQDDKPRGDLESRRQSPKQEDTTVWMDAPPRSGGAAPRENDTQNYQPTREPKMFPRKAQTAPPESIHVPNRVRQNSMHEFRVSTKKKDDIHNQNFRPIREPIQVSPRKETQTTPPESTHVSSYRARQNSMHEFRTLTKEKKGLQGQLSTMQDVLDTTLNTSEARMKEIGRLKEEVQRLDSIVFSMVSEGKIAGNKIGDLERRVRQQDEDIRNLEQKLRISEEQRSQTTKLLDDRTAELKGAQVFLTTADRYSGADIIKMAESLNAEIFQASALMAELLVDAPVFLDSVRQRQYVQGYKNYLDQGRKIIGSQLFDHLVTKSSEIRVDPLPLQLAFQALFTWWCVYEVNHFCEGPTGESLKQIYKRIYESEIQAVAGRWRVMTSVQTMNSGTPSHARSVFNVILGLMWICRWFESRDTSQRAKICVHQAVLRVEKLWKTLKAAIMQEITAAEITMLDVGAGSDYNAAKMDDMYIEASSDATTNPDNCRQQILCGVGVGLQREVSKRSADGTMQIHQEVILKPKVALASVLLNGESSLDMPEEMVLSATDGKD